MLLVPCLPISSNLFLMNNGPGDHTLQFSRQAEAFRSEDVGHLWRNCGSHRPRDQAIALETAQGERQHALRDGVDAALELSEAFGFR